MKTRTRLGIHRIAVEILKDSDDDLRRAIGDALERAGASDRDAAALVEAVCGAFRGRRP